MNHKLLIALIWLTSISTAYAQNDIVLHMKDGTTVTYSMDNVDFIEMTSAKQVTDTVEYIGGTVATPVDLGLSINWASHNLGSTSSDGLGGGYSWNEAKDDVALWKANWRMPTDEEWQELLEKCEWEWTIRNGIGGRLVTGPSGNSIFFPATGLNIDGKPYIAGSVGIYWSATTDKDEANHSVGEYFDSANIYHMNFPRTNRFAIRAVTTDKSGDGIDAPNISNDNIRYYRRGNTLIVNGVSAKSIAVYSHDGQLQAPTLTDTPTSTVIDFSSMPQGIYIIKPASFTAIKFINNK